VREVYALDDDRLLLVASDRISIFDVVLPTPIPRKGCVLTGLSAYWFSRIGDIVPHHLLSIRPDGRSMECRRLRMLPVEFVVRGYLAGSAWTDYRASGSVCGHRLPEGLSESERLPQPIVTPATKAASASVMFKSCPEAAELCGPGHYATARGAALDVYEFASRRAETAGIIVADTKLEFGLDQDADVVLGDEVLTPDSSRFWPAESYRPGGPQPSFDKQFVRDWALASGWDRTAPGPEVPDDVVAGTQARYADAFALLTGVGLEAYLDNPEVVVA
jgi:phosphoribosylaminoimidazole-succinocarboxamide synthase